MLPSTVCALRAWVTRASPPAAIPPTLRRGAATRRPASAPTCLASRTTANCRPPTARPTPRRMRYVPADSVGLRVRGGPTCRSRGHRKPRRADTHVPEPDGPRWHHRRRALAASYRRSAAHEVAALPPGLTARCGLARPGPGVTPKVMTIGSRASPPTTTTAANNNSTKHQPTTNHNSVAGKWQASAGSGGSARHLLVVAVVVVAQL